MTIEDSLKRDFRVDEREMEKDYLSELLSEGIKGGGESDPFDPSTVDDDGILSLLGAGDENSVQIEHELLPELNEIIEVPLEEGAEIGDELSQFAHLPAEEKIAAVPTEEPKAEAPEVSLCEDESLMKIFAAKLGVEIEKMSKQEREAFVVDAATMLTVAFERICGSVRGIRKLKKDMGMLPLMDEIGKNPLMESKNTKELFEGSKGEHLALSGYLTELFDEIDMHNIAFFESVTRERRDLMRKFSPEDLYKRFEREKRLSGVFRSRKSLAWDAYTKEFSDLDDGSLDMESITKEYRRVTKSLKVGFGK